MKSVERMKKWDREIADALKKANRYQLRQRHEAGGRARTRADRKISATIHERERAFRPLIGKLKRRFRQELGNLPGVWLEWTYSQNWHINYSTYRAWIELHYRVRYKALEISRSFKVKEYGDIYEEAIRLWNLLNQWREFPPKKKTAGRKWDEQDQN